MTEVDMPGDEAASSSSSCSWLVLCADDIGCKVCARCEFIGAHGPGLGPGPGHDAVSPLRTRFIESSSPITPSASLRCTVENALRSMSMMKSSPLTLNNVIMSLGTRVATPSQRLHHQLNRRTALLTTSSSSSSSVRSDEAHHQHDADCHLFAEFAEALSVHITAEGMTITMSTHAKDGEHDDGDDDGDGLFIPWQSFATHHMQWRCIARTSCAVVEIPVPPMSLRYAMLLSEQSDEAYHQLPPPHHHGDGTAAGGGVRSSSSSLSSSSMWKWIRHRHHHHSDDRPQRDTGTARPIGDIIEEACSSFSSEGINEVIVDLHEHAHMLMLCLDCASAFDRDVLVLMSRAMSANHHPQPHHDEEEHHDDDDALSLLPWTCTRTAGADAAVLSASLSSSCSSSTAIHSNEAGTNNTDMVITMTKTESTDKEAYETQLRALRNEVEMLRMMNAEAHRDVQV